MPPLRPAPCRRCPVSQGCPQEHDDAPTDGQEADNPQGQITAPPPKAQGAGHRRGRESILGEPTPDLWPPRCLAAIPASPNLWMNAALHLERRLHAIMAVEKTKHWLPTSKATPTDISHSRLPQNVGKPHRETMLLLDLVNGGQGFLCPYLCSELGLSLSKMFSVPCVCARCKTLRQTSPPPLPQQERLWLTVCPLPSQVINMSLAPSQRKSSIS